MTERQPSGNEHEFSRRVLFKRVLAASAVSVVSYQLLNGISFNNHPLALRQFTIGNGTEDDIRLSSEYPSRQDGESYITITPAGKILYEPTGKFFIHGRKFKYAHRGGNSLESIDEAYRIGADLFDIDANCVAGTVRGEHGIIPQAKFRDKHFYLPVILDVDEDEVKFGMPSTYEELVAYIASLSTPERPLAVATELKKRGEFEPDTLYEMFDIHRKYDIPAIINPTDPHQLGFIDNGVQ